VAGAAAGLAALGLRALALGALALALALGALALGLFAGLAAGDGGRSVEGVAGEAVEYADFVHGVYLVLWVVRLFAETRIVAETSRNYGKNFRMQLKKQYCSNFFRESLNRREIQRLQNIRTVCADLGS
jgi:hypothetical protein